MLLPQQVERYCTARLYHLYADLLEVISDVPDDSIDYLWVRCALGECMAKFNVKCLTPEESAMIATVAGSLAESVPKPKDARNADNLRAIAKQFRERGSFWLRESGIGPQPTERQ
jgi:hypothetical protein